MVTFYIKYNIILMYLPSSCELDNGRVTCTTRIWLFRLFRQFTKWLFSIKNYSFPHEGEPRYIGNYDGKSNYATSGNRARDLPRARRVHKQLRNGSWLLLISFIYLVYITIEQILRRVFDTIDN